MLTSASPGRAAAMVPAPVERSQLGGHRQRSPNSAAPTVGPALIIFAALYARARRWDADDGTGGAMRARGWRATALPFQQLR